MANSRGALGLGLGKLVLGGHGAEVERQAVGAPATGERVPDGLVEGVVAGVEAGDGDVLVRQRGQLGRQTVHLHRAGLRYRDCAGILP